MVVEEVKFRVCFEKRAGVNGVGVGEENQAVALLLEGVDEVPHGGVE